MREKPETCAVVVTYNRKELVEQCISAILSQEDASCDIIVIDNGSTDGTSELFNSVFKDKNIDYENVGENLGCAESTARLMKKAVERGYKYVWIMDDDVIPEKKTLSTLLEADKKLNGIWGILSSVAYWTDGSICEANRQKKTLFSFMRDKDYIKDYVPVKMVSLASMFVKSDVIRDVGLIKGEYFIYSEDYEFCGRVGVKYPIYVVTTSMVTHAMRENRKVNIVKDTSDRLYRYIFLYRNDVNCYKQFGFQGCIYLILKYVYTFLQILLFENNNKQQKVEILFNGYKSGMHFNPKIEYPNDV